MSISPPMFPDREDAAALAQQHARLREMSASPIDMGTLYQTALDNGLWTSQAEMARALGVSKSYVSKALKAAQLPEEVVAAVGGKDRVSFRVAATLDSVIHSVGLKIVRLRASIIGGRRDLEISDIISSIATGRLPVGAGRMVSIKICRARKFIKIESPNIEKLIANLPEIEAQLIFYLC